MFLGQGWLPLHVVSVTYQTGEVLLDFYVPVPPLQIKHVFVIQELKMLPHYGFSLYHGSTELTIDSVKIASDTTILISFVDSFGVAPTVSYGDMTNKGSGNICDSDPTVALHNWVFTAGSGQYLTEDFPGPISDTQIVSNNQPYPLWNFLCPFTQIQAVPG